MIFGFIILALLFGWIETQSRFWLLFLIAVLILLEVAFDFVLFDRGRKYEKGDTTHVMEESKRAEHGDKTFRQRVRQITEYFTKTYKDET
jgi:hypothetical protein